MKAILIAMILAGATVPALAAEDGGRFRLSATDLLRVIDSQTGAVWIAKGDGKGGYILVPVPYQSADGKQVTTTAPKSD
jgi:hypothetical protein